MPSTKISLSDLAPKESTDFNLGGAEVFTLSGKKVYQTDDEVVISAADAHEWLTVERPVAADSPFGGFREPLAPQDDHLSSLGSPINPNDPDEAAKAEAAKLQAEGVNVSIDVNKAQSEPVLVADKVAETLAADDTSKTSSKTKDKD